MSPAERSTFVTVLAWVLIVLSGFGSLMTLLQNVVLFFVFPFAEMSATAIEADEPLWARFIYLWFVLALLVCATTLVGSIGLLQRKSWGRRLVVTILGLGVVWCLVAAPLGHFMMQMPADFGEVDPGLRRMQTVTTVFSAVFGLLLAGLFGWLVKRLLSAEVRAEFG